MARSQPRQSRQDDLVATCIGSSVYLYARLVIRPTPARGYVKTGRSGRDRLLLEALSRTPKLQRRCSPHLHSPRAAAAPQFRLNSWTHYALREPQPNNGGNSKGKTPVSPAHDLTR